MHILIIWSMDVVLDSSGYLSGSNISVASQSTASSNFTPIQRSSSQSNSSERPLTQLEEEKRRLARRKEHIMTELLQTERMWIVYFISKSIVVSVTEICNLSFILSIHASYVKDLEDCIRHYLSEMRTGRFDIPSGIRGKEAIIFSNIEQLYRFHR